MVYQRFLNASDKRARNISISLNDKILSPWDPFCEDEEGTELVAEKKVKTETQNGKESEFYIRAFVLPRREQFSSTERMNEARLTNDMQGIYIYRENRLICPSGWLGMFAKEPHLTLLRLEFSFDHNLDEAFQIDIKKSRITLNEEILNWY